MAEEHISLRRNIQVGESIERVIDVNELVFCTAILRRNGIALCSYLAGGESGFNLINVEVVKGGDARYGALYSQLEGQD